MYKHQQINESGDEERQDLLADYENDRYIPLYFLKVSNCLVNLGKETKSLTHLINIELKKYQIRY